MMNSLKINMGFTLIEIIIVLTIISILSIVSFPLYTEHVVRTRRIYMATILLDLAARMEKHYVINNTYDGINSEIKSLTNNPFYKDHYEIQIIVHKDLYTLKAIPIGKQIGDACGTLIIDQNGNKSVSGTEDVTKCWS